jgi:hypothetical protein
MALPEGVDLEAYVECYNETWTPDLDSQHLQDAAVGLSSLALPIHAPAEVTDSIPTPAAP